MFTGWIGDYIYIYSHNLQIFLCGRFFKCMADIIFQKMIWIEIRNNHWDDICTDPVIKGLPIEEDNETTDISGTEEEAAQLPSFFVSRLKPEQKHHGINFLHIHQTNGMYQYIILIYYYLIFTLCYLSLFYLLYLIFFTSALALETT